MRRIAGTCRFEFGQSGGRSGQTTSPRFATANIRQIKATTAKPAQSASPNPIGTKPAASIPTAYSAINSAAASRRYRPTHSNKAQQFPSALCRVVPASVAGAVSGLGVLFVGTWIMLSEFRFRLPETPFLSATGFGEAGIYWHSPQSTKLPLGLAMALKRLPSSDTKSTAWPWWSTVSPSGSAST